ncbi:MAG TPA: polysaccharide deacetylase family protein [Blastocatellia bacterium]|nr:polysaccharide deacetylase family protein [Blastocatellia bacterium]
MKQTVLNLMNHAGVFAPFRMANSGKALIVTYHRFSEDGVACTVSAKALAQQLDYLTTHYRIVPLSEIAGHLASGKRLPRRLVSVTVDDGYRDFYESAFPVFRRYKVPAALFVVTGFVDRQAWMWTDKLRYLLPRARTSILDFTAGGRAVRVNLDGLQSRLEIAGCINAVLKSLPDDAKDETIAHIATALGLELPPAPPREFSSVTWDHVREMDTAGIEIGSHTVTHPILTNVAIDRVRDELSESRERIESVVGHAARLFCYPNGGYNAAVKREAAQAGYICAVVSEPGFNDSGCDPMALRRIHGERDLAHFAQSTSGFEQAKNRWRRGRGPAAVPAYEHLSI